ncbi:SDR family oxidoreductase [Catenovulum sediminis]|uniref:SDR family oxidoreductase n=1 Tax=Catenovulum sediminis TaxID=1740262 RepID=A0ABV1RFQ3_9ALTE
MQQHMVITGATSGIGRALAIEAAKSGFKLSLCGRNEERLRETVKLLPDDTRVYTDTFCASESDKIHQFIGSASQELGNVDILVNCAGLNSARGEGHQVSIDDLHWMMQINCYAPIEFCKAVIPQMQALKQGKIVNVLSTVCLFANPGIAAYSASKAALDSYTKVMRKERRQDNIHFISVYPGGVDTSFRASERPMYLSAKSVAKAIMANLKADANTHIHELVLRPQVEENF